MAKCSRCGATYYYNQLKNGCIFNFRLKTANVAHRHVPDDEAKGAHGITSEFLTHGMNFCPACSAAFLDWMNGSSVVGNESERVKQLQDIAKNATAEIGQLRNQIFVLRDSESHLLEKIQNLEIDNNQIREINSNLKKQLQVRSTNAGNFYSAYVNKIAEYNSLKDQFDAVSKERDGLRAEAGRNNFLTSINVALTAENGRLREQIKDGERLHDEIEALKDALYDLECEKEELSNDLLQSRAESIKLSVKISDAIDTLKRY